MRPLARLALRSSLAVLALSATAGTAAQATAVPGANGKIAFASGRPSLGIPTPDPGDADARIWVADYPGGTPQQVTTLPVGMQHRHPNWSPDHTKIAYAAGAAFSATSTYAIWIADLETGNQTEFVPAAAGQDRPAWSPDGTRIAYGSGGHIWVKDVAQGSTAVQLTNTGTADARPAWSPDGTTLYFNRGAPGSRDIYRKTPVTPAGIETTVFADAVNDDWQPAVSPDGARLCFLRGPQSDAADLYTVNVNGTGVTPFSTTNAVGDLNCVWSPDGTRVLYTLGAFGAGELSTRDVNGGDFQSLTTMNVASHFDGNADWATNLPPTCDATTANVGVNGFVTIALSCTDPDRGLGAAPPTPTPLDPGALTIASSPAHGNIGALSNGTVIYTPGKDFHGTDTFTYTGNDDVSDSAPATVTIHVGAEAGGGGGGGGARDVTAPAISRLTVSPARWRRGSALPGIARVRTTPVGTTISFRLSEAARVTLGFDRARAGRRVGRTCAKPTRGNRTRRACTRFVPAGSIAGLAGKAGLNKLRFQGCLSRTRRLALGRYRVVVSARDAAGNRSGPRTGPTFTIVAR